MKYVWIWILFGFDVIWAISSIMDMVRTVKYVKEHKRYDSVGFVDYTIGELKESTVGFIALHLFVLFLASLIAWLDFKTGGAG